MADVRVECVIRDVTGRITDVGNPNAHPGPWTRTVAQVVQTIDLGVDTFYVQFDGQPRAEVRVVRADPPYLRTEANGVPNDNLDRLPVCRTRYG